MSSVVRVSDSDSSTLLSFSSSTSEAPLNNESIGILEQLKDDRSADPAATLKAEEALKSNHAGLTTAKEEEFSTLTAAIDTKLAWPGHFTQETNNLKNDIADTQRPLAADPAEPCSSQSSLRQESRVEELAAINDTMTVSDDDDVLESSMPANAGTEEYLDKGPRGRSRTSRGRGARSLQDTSTELIFGAAPTEHHGTDQRSLQERANDR